MNDLLQALYALFKAELLGYKKIDIMSDYEAELALKIESLPALLIKDVGETSSNESSFNNLIWRNYRVKLRIILKTAAGPSKWIKGSDNIYDRTDALWQLVRQHPRIGGMDRLLPTFDVENLEVLYTPTNGIFTCRDIFITFISTDSFNGGTNRI